MAVVVPFKAPPQPKNSGPLAAGADPFDETHHPYVNASGQVAFEVVWVTDARNKRNKASLQRRPSEEGDGSWLRGLDAGEYMRRAPGKNWIRFDPAKFEQYPATRQRKFFNDAAPIPYQLPELLKAVAAGHTICVAEDELEVDFLRSFDFCATCCAGGAKNWRPEHSAFLQGADVVLYNDAKIIAPNLAPIARRLRILENDTVVDLHAVEPPLNPRLAAALSYAERGWDVFPANLSLNKATGKFNKKSYKSAEYSGGANWGKTRDPKQIKKDFKRWPKANVGIATGADSGIFVVETDTPKGHNVDGEASLRAREEKHGPLPKTLMAESPSGSRHRYFKYPPGIEIKNSTSSIARGIDVRGEGGMVIAPPSVRGDGAYRWLNDNPIADAPQWLIDLAVDSKQLDLTRKSTSGNGGEDHARFKVAEELKDLPLGDLGENIETNQWWDRLSGEQKDAALDHGLECIAKNSNLLKLGVHGGNNADYHDLVTSIARSGAPRAEGIFIHYASKVTGADSPDKLREHFKRAQTPRTGGITVGTFIDVAKECSADFSP